MVIVWHHLAALCKGPTENNPSSMNNTIFSANKAHRHWKLFFFRALTLLFVVSFWYARTRHIHSRAHTLPMSMPCGIRRAELFWRKIWGEDRVRVNNVLRKNGRRYALTPYVNECVSLWTYTRFRIAAVDRRGNSFTLPNQHHHWTMLDARFRLTFILLVHVCMFMRDALQNVKRYNVCASICCGELPCATAQSVRHVPF